MTMVKAYTSLEQSKKLAEILPLKSADMSYRASYSGNGVISGYQATLCPFTLASWIAVPCWSLAALINLLPSEFTTENDLGIFKHEIKIRKYKFTNDVDLYQIAYGSIKFDVDGQYSFKDMINTGEKEELLDAAFEMVCWLKETETI